MTAGAGLTGQIALRDLPPNSPNNATLSDLTIAPAVAPWIGARVGVAGDNEAGLTYTGRSLRVDGRHAFLFGASGATALSLGLGASAVIARRPGQEPDGSGVFGGGFDVPVLFGWRSQADLYSVWIGPRAGLEFLSGRAPIASGTSPTLELGDVTARHVFAGFVAGLRVGFRHVHAAIEVNGAYHRVDGSFKPLSTGLNQLTITPGGALIISF